MARSVSLVSKRFYRVLALVCVTALAIVWMAFALAGAQSAWAAQEASTLHAGDAISIGVADEEALVDDENGRITVSERTAGTVSFNSSTCVLTLNNLKADEVYVSYPKPVTINLVGASVVDTFADNCDAATIKGSGSFKGDFQIDAGDNATLTVAGGKLVGEIKGAYGARLVVKGGTVVGSVTLEGPITVKGGTIRGTSLDHGISCYSFKMTSGVVNFSKVEVGVQIGYNGIKSCDFVMSGGKIVISQPSTGIDLFGCNAKISGGTIKIVKAADCAIEVGQYKNKGKKIGGTLKVTGGKLTCTSKSDTAIDAESMKNKLGTLKKIQGYLPIGATFVLAKNTYQVTYWGYATLLKYGSTSKKATIYKVKYGNKAYEVTGIGKNAFNTKAGKKVKSIIIKSPINKISAKAFAGTKSLKLLKFANRGNNWIDGKTKTVSGEMNEWEEYTSFFVCEGVSVSNKAFANMGTNGGTGLTVRIADFNTFEPQEMVLFEKFMKSKGMPANVKLVTV